MKQKTSDQAQQELRAIFAGIFEHVHRREKETTILNASRMERPAEQSDSGRTAMWVGTNHSQ